MKNTIPVVGYDAVWHQDIKVASDDWYQWLESVPSFRYQCVDGSFTARKYGNYWNAYRKRFSKLRCEYLGRTQDLTLDRLLAVSKTLDQPDRDYWMSKAERRKLKA